MNEGQNKEIAVGVSGRSCDLGKTHPQTQQVNADSIPLLESGSIFLLSRRMSFHMTLSFQCNFVLCNDSVT